MKFLRNDLYRNLGLGFLIGAVGIVIANPAFAHVVTALV